MLRQMERSAIVVMAKRGKSVRQIAAELGHSPTTIARALKEPVDRRRAPRQRRSKVDPYREQIAAWLAQGLTVTRMLELARTEGTPAYTGGHSVFRETVRRLRRERERVAADVHGRPSGVGAL